MIALCRRFHHNDPGLKHGTSWCLSAADRASVNLIYTGGDIHTVPPAVPILQVPALESIVRAAATAATAIPTAVATAA
jgi:hypothetical protein